MSRDFLKERERALENAWFRKREAELMAETRAERDRDKRVTALAEACGIRDREVLSTLLELGIEAEAVAALALVPLVAVAWADGECGLTERHAILEAAHQAGIDRGEPGHALLEQWLEARPAAALFKAWIDFAHALRDQVDDEQRAALRKDFVERATHVADVVGGLLNLGPHISAEERKVLGQIEDSL
jgi:uncharacterized tellurite resistance protein B-like protein